MAKNSSSVPYALEETEGAREANRQYQAALAKLTQSLDQRKNRFFDPVWLAASQGFSTPGVTDFFGSLGHVASNVNRAQEGLIKENQDIAQQRLELAGRGVELERQKAKDAMVRRELSEEDEPTRPAGALPTTSRSQAGEPSGAQPAQGALSQAQGDPAQDMGIQLFPGSPGISRKRFFNLGLADGKNMSDLAKEWEAIVRGRLQVRDNSLFDTGSGRAFMVPSADTVQVQIFNRDGSTPKTYPVTKSQAIRLSELAEKNDAEGYFALADRIIRGPQLQSAQQAAPSAPVVAPAAAAVSALPSPPPPLRTSGSAGAQAVPGSVPSNPARLPPVASGRVPEPQGGAQAAQGAPAAAPSAAADNQANLRQIPPKGTKDIFAGQLSEEEKQRIASDPNLKDFYETFSQNAASFLNRPTNSNFYKQNVHRITEQAKRLNDLGIKVPGTLEEIRQVLGVRFPDPPDFFAPEDFAGGQKMFNEIRRDYGEDAARSFNENGYLYTKNFPRLTPAAPSTAAARVPTPQAAAAPTQAAPPVVPQAAPSAAARPATAVVPPAAPVAPAAVSSAAAQAAPVAPGRAAAAGATGRAGLLSVQESESIKAREKALQEADVQMEVEARKDFNQRFRDAGDSITMANMLRRFSEDPNASKMTGILNNDKISSGIARLVKDGVGARDYRIGIAAIEDVMRNAGLNPADQAKYRVFLMNTAQMRLQMSKYMKGSVSNYEQDLMGEAAVSSQDTPQTIRMKADLLARRAQFDRKAYRAFKSSRMTAEEFLESKAYEDMRDEYDKQLTGISVGALRYQPSTSNPATNTPARGAPRAAVPGAGQPSPGFIRDPQTGMIRRKRPGE